MKKFQGIPSAQIEKKIFTVVIPFIKNIHTMLKLNYINST